jgi:RimJ/RimL family protein N-acetyltransferase
MSNEEKPKPPSINVRGAKVGLGPFLKEHVEDFYNWIQDPEVGLYSDGTYTLPNLEHEKEVFEQVGKEGANFAIYELEKLTLIGSCGLYQLDYRHGFGSFGITIGLKEFWSKGYGTEATKLVLEYGFRFLNLHNIDLSTVSFNRRGIRAYQKAGFKEIGRRRGAILIGGQRYDRVYMDCLSTEFEPPTPGWFTLK